MYNFLRRTNASAEENRLALIRDSQAFGIGCATFSLLQLIVGAISVDLFNYVALKQVPTTFILNIYTTILPPPPSPDNDDHQRRSATITLKVFSREVSGLE